MDAWIRRLVGWGAIAAPALHTITDVMEWAQGGFSPPQLWINYAAFVPLPAILIGLYAAQRPAIGRLGLAGALAYGYAFIYFAHTTLVALSSRAPDYETLWAGLGGMYTAHGVIMIAGGLAFGWATLRARVLPRGAAALFLAGVVVNAVLGLLPVPDLLQTIGSTVRNLGLIGLGWAISRDASHRPRADGAATAPAASPSAS